MKRIARIAAAACLAFALCLALAACGNNKAEYVGSWNLESGTDENLDADSIALMKSLGLEVVLTLQDDGTGSLSLFGDTLDLTWEASSASEGTAVVDGAEAKLLLSDGKLTLEDSAGAQMTFVKDEAAAVGESGSASASSASADASSGESANAEEPASSDAADADGSDDAEASSSAAAA